MGPETWGRPGQMQGRGGGLAQLAPLAGGPAALGHAPLPLLRPRRAVQRRAGAEQPEDPVWPVLCGKHAAVPREAVSRPSAEPQNGGLWGSEPLLPFSSKGLKRQHACFSLPFPEGGKPCFLL